LEATTYNARPKTFTVLRMSLYCFLLLVC